MTDAIAGFGATLKYAAGTLVGHLTSIGGMKLKAETIDTTNHDSTNGWKEFIASGLKDGGEFPIEGQFIQDNTGQLALIGHIGGAVQSFVVTFPDTSTWTFSAIVTGVEVGKADLKDAIGFSATLKITGQPVFAGVTSVSVVTFTVTAAAGGALLENATVLFNGETKLTNVSGVAAFSNVPYATYSYAVTKTLYVGQAATQVVNGATEAVAVALALA